MANYLITLAALTLSVTSSPTNYSPLEDRSPLAIPTIPGATPYAPVIVSCPAHNLVRASSGGVNPDEAAQIVRRKAAATTSLKSWLASTGTTFPALTNAQYPNMALVDGGGGLRGFLISAGVHKAFDSAESTKTPMSGLYQSMTYEAGLSGTSETMGTFASNNWPTVSSLQTSLWEPAIENGILKPDGGSPVALTGIVADLAAKQAAGFPVTIADVFGRFLGYVALQGNRGGVAKRWSDVLNESGYTSASKPYPIITALGIENQADGCGLPPKTATQYEFTPHEFGSWESGVANFMQTKYIGTSMMNGKPSTLNLTCTNGFDNVNWIMGTSTDTLNQICGQQITNVESEAARLGVLTQADLNMLTPLLREVLGNAVQPLYAQMPNPFFGLTSASKVSSAPLLQLIDGGESIQVPPIWPFLYRPDVSVLFISDNSADNPRNYPAGTRANFPGGNQLYNTYTQAGINGVQNRLPVIPPPAQFQAKGLNKRTTFFGCYQPATSPAMMIIYFPNRDITFNSSQPANRLVYDNADANSMISNGAQIAQDGGTKGFNTCVGCALMKKAALKAGKALPAACGACFKKYCYMP